MDLEPQESTDAAAVRELTEIMLFIDNTPAKVHILNAISELSIGRGIGAMGIPPNQFGPPETATEAVLRAPRMARPSNPGREAARAMAAEDGAPPGVAAVAPPPRPMSPEQKSEIIQLCSAAGRTGAIEWTSVPRTDSQAKGMINSLREEVAAKQALSVGGQL